MRNLEMLHAVTNPDRFLKQGSVLGSFAHPDDEAMDTVIHPLIQAGVEVDLHHHTDGSGRGTRNFTPDQLSSARWQESLIAGEELGIRQVSNGTHPDGQLFEYYEQGVIDLEELVERRQPDALMTSFPLDQHIDHRAAAAITRQVAKRRKLPLYYTDTISGRDIYGNPIIPTHYIDLSRRGARRQRRGYLGNETQTTNLPPGEMRDVFSVVAMSRRRGKEVGVSHVATVVFSAADHRADVLGEMLAGRRI